MRRSYVGSSLAWALMLLVSLGLRGVPQTAPTGVGVPFRLGPETLVGVKQDGGLLRSEPSVAIADNMVVD